jgi:hypothetical protein
MLFRVHLLVVAKPIFSPQNLLNSMSEYQGGHYRGKNGNTKNSSRR